MKKRSLIFFLLAFNSTAVFASLELKCKATDFMYAVDLSSQGSSISLMKDGNIISSVDDIYTSFVSANGMTRYELVDSESDTSANLLWISQEKRGNGWIRFKGVERSVQCKKN